MSELEKFEEVARRLDRTAAQQERAMGDWQAGVAAGPDDPAIVSELFEAAVGLGKLRDGIRELKADIARSYEEEAAKERREWERREAAKLNTVFSDEVVFEALRRVLEKSQFSDAFAGEVAAELGALPTQSDRVRAGKALRRLADAGKVRRIEAKDTHRANRWALNA